MPAAISNLRLRGVFIIFHRLLSGISDDENFLIKMEPPSFLPPLGLLPFRLMRWWSSFVIIDTTMLLVDLNVTVFCGFYGCCQSWAKNEQVRPCQFRCPFTRGMYYSTTPCPRGDSEISVENSVQSKELLLRGNRDSHNSGVVRYRWISYQSRGDGSVLLFPILLIIYWNCFH